MSAAHFFRPPLSQAAFFALYELTNRGSSWLGPLILTSSIATTGQYTWAFIYICVVCEASAIGIFFIDMRKGHEAAVARGNLPRAATGAVATEQVAA